MDAIKRKDFEHLEAVHEEVQPLLWYVADITGRRHLDQLPVSEHSTVGNLIWDDADGRTLAELRVKLGVPVEYADTLVHVVRRFRAACLARL